MRLEPLVAIMFSTLALAGCVGNDSPVDDGNTVVNPDDYVLAEGKGAIAGLLVDDRFRPIHLVEGEPATEFQATGFILVQETAAQIRTNADGVFQILDLEPGQYSLKLETANHEAIPARVNVEEGLFNEITIEARRVANLDDVIITQEHAAFASCFTNFVWLSLTADCTFDASGDTGRAAWSPNMTQYGEDAHYVVMEILFDNPPPPSTAYDFVTRGSGIGTDYSGVFFPDDGNRYGKIHLPINRESPDPWISGSGCEASPSGPDGWCPFNTSKPLSAIIFGRGFFHGEIKGAYAPAQGVVATTPCGPNIIGECVHHATMRRGAGGALATKAIYMMSVFMFDPEPEGEDPLHETDYCALCNPD